MICKVSVIFPAMDKLGDLERCYSNYKSMLSEKYGDPKDGVGIRFGVVVTLKEINCVNRIDEFVKNCNLSGWLVNTIDIKTRIDIHEKVNEEIEFQ